MLEDRLCFACAATNSILYVRSAVLLPHDISGDRSIRVRIGGLRSMCCATYAALVDVERYQADHSRS